MIDSLEFVIKNIFEEVGLSVRSLKLIGRKIVKKSKLHLLIDKSQKHKSFLIEKR